MDFDQEVANLDESTQAMSVEDAQAAMWARAPLPDARFANNSLTFEPLYQEGTVGDHAGNIAPVRPRTKTTTELKRKNPPGNDAGPTPKRAKEADAATKGEHQIAAKKLWSEYLMRGGVSQAGVTLSEKEFTDALPDRFRTSTHPEMYRLEDFVYDLLPATEAPVPLNQTTAVPPTEFETAPTDLIAFIKWARKQIDVHTPADSKRLLSAIGSLRNPDTRMLGFELASKSLGNHLTRLVKSAKDAKALYAQVKQDGPPNPELLESIGRSARQLEMRKDDFYQRMTAFHEEAKSKF
ncbi:hypothetical protein J4E93_008909 [Alternaria ventricosa]|uniref:uncharacterized protein n=1 Tax=Alternaria ventricosa TaxID=1187951 RepID=UPI0020C55F18|nr:uncharacterized protein J4E93_008909 [Alternaria ventricosa]KAI4640109.1 hypothetical protein J4E93_008909 [Alternaria ventricosa]